MKEQLLKTLGSTAPAKHLTADKTAFVIERDKSQVTGFVVQDQCGGIGIINCSAVRWLTKDELWWLMHQSGGTPMHQTNEHVRAFCEKHEIPSGDNAIESLMAHTIEQHKQIAAKDEALEEAKDWIENTSVHYNCECALGGSCRYCSKSERASRLIDSALSPDSGKDYARREELEKVRDEVNVAWVTAIDKEYVLKSELDKTEKQRAYFESISRDYRSRAESAEARVKELEEKLKNLDHIPGVGIVSTKSKAAE